MSLLAKSIRRKDGSQISLKDHTRRLLDVYGHIQKHLEKHSPSHLVNDYDDAVQISLLCHDLGKVNPAFQGKIGNPLSRFREDDFVDFSHSLFSLFWIDTEKIDEVMGKEDFPVSELVKSAVAFHHWHERFLNLLNGIDDSPAMMSEKLFDGSPTELACRLESLLKDEMNGLNIDGVDASGVIKFQERVCRGLLNGLSLQEFARAPYTNYFLPQLLELDQRQKEAWILISGFLQRCDHFASFCEEEGIGVDNVEIEPVDPGGLQKNIVNVLSDHIQIDSINDIWQGKELNKDNYADNNVVLVAPTGIGKTEFSFLWANKTGGNKLFYTLPLRSAVNQIFDRSIGLFGKDKVGLLHSDADLHWRPQGEEDYSSPTKIRDMARQLAYPVMVTTGDQFFPYALRPPGYEKIYATFSYSRLVIDEVQAYDPRAAAIIVKFIEDIARMGGKFLLMTATLPDFIREEIEGRIGEDLDGKKYLNMYEEKKEKLKCLAKHKIRLRLLENPKPDKKDKAEFVIDDELLDEIIGQKKQGQRVLIIANTVRFAQDIYQRLREKLDDKDVEDLNILHSRFTQKDRQEKEETLEETFGNPKPEGESEGKILVATQVVEASLDLDADVMYTELAPMDSLVQRMGRVLRRYREDYKHKDDPNIHVLVSRHGLHSLKSGYDWDLVYLTLKTLVSEIEDKKISTDELKEWNKKVQEKNDRKNKNQECPKSVFGESKTLTADEPISDYEKFNMVDQIYKCLPENNPYLKKFYQTLDVLDAGFMSDRRGEAQDIFRRIYSISALALGEYESFENDLIKFFNQSDEEIDYTRFKREILSKYIFSDSYWGFRKEASESSLLNTKIEEKGAINSIPEEHHNRIKRWLAGYYVLPVEYDPFSGVGKRIENRKPDVESQFS